MLKLFLSYSHGDLAAARRLYEELSADAGLEVWFDKESLSPGQRWEPAIRKAISECRFFLLLISKASTGHRGFYQREVRVALEILQSYPNSDTFLIPVRLDDCEPHFEELNALHYVDLFPDWNVGMARILRVFAEHRGAAPAARAQLAQVRFTTHQASFPPSSRLHYFLNVANLSDRNVTVTHAWYEDARTHIPVSLRSRPLPVILTPGDLWSTWIAIDAIPAANRHAAYESFRLRLATGEVLVATEDTTIPPYGSVAGGPIRSEDLEAATATSDTVEPSPPITGAGSADLPSDRQELYLRFWSRYLNQVRATHPNWTAATRSTRQNYMNQACPLDGCRLAPAFKNDGRLGHELVVMSPDAERNLEIFSSLRDRQAAFEQSYGRKLTWDDRPGSKRCLIGEYRQGSIEQVDTHAEYIDWFIDCGERLRRAIDHVSTTL